MLICNSHVHCQPYVSKKIAVNSCLETYNDCKYMCHGSANCCLYFSSAGEPDLKTGKKREQLLQKQPETAKRNRDQRVSQLENVLQLKEKEIISLKEQLENKGKKMKPEMAFQSTQNENTKLTSKLHVWQMFWLFMFSSSSTIEIQLL